MSFCPECGEEAEYDPDTGRLICKHCGWHEPDEMEGPDVPEAGEAQGEKEEKPVALEVREEKLASILPKIDCTLIDARARKVLLYLINEEVKKLGRMPAKWSKDSLEEMQGIKEGLEMCKGIRSKKQESQEDDKGGWLHKY